MEKNVVHQTRPFIVPTGDGKLIEEHFGVASHGDGTVSIAHMVAPATWTEPSQKPEFDEYTLMVRGSVQVELPHETITITAGQSILVPAGVRVRYANPFRVEAEYWSVCIPAFTPDRAHRLDD